MIDKLQSVADKYKEIEQKITLPEVVCDNRLYSSLVKEYKALTPVMEGYTALLQAKKMLKEAEDILHDPYADSDLKMMAEEEWAAYKEKLPVLENQLRILLLPQDPNDGKNVVVEIRQGTGGEEAALFCADLFRMYSMFCASNGLSLRVVSNTPTELGGYKEIVFTVSGADAYSKFKFESGVHRVQRIPVTESGGRIQTSAATVAVLPEAEEVEIFIAPSDLKFESCKSSGAGGQHINKTESAVRLTHIPSGIVVECDSERSQLQNKETALRLLRTKLFDIEQKKRNDEIANARKMQVGGGDRSEKIRTYNYPQSRVTDHRIGKTLYTLDRFMDGDMNELLTELLANETAEKLKGDHV